ncbi:MAG TPA: hypothetical protein VHL98_04320 [Microvirga sp.]|nr:hypothetical protein [Microvirga sp.]
MTGGRRHSRPWSARGILAAAGLALAAIPGAGAAPRRCPLTAATFAPLEGPPGLALTVRDGEQGPVWRLAWEGTDHTVEFGTVSHSGNGHTILVEEQPESSGGESVETRAEVFDAGLSALNLPRAIENPGRRLAAYVLLPGLRDGLARKAKAGPARPLPAEGLWVVRACAEERP